jgi:hypothetical protein
LAMIHPFFSMILIPMNWLFIKIGKKSEKDYLNWKIRYNEANLQFPGGINDWFAYGILVFLILIPILVISVKFRIDIYTNKYYFGGIAISIGAICYYWIYFRSIDWLKIKINMVKKKYYFK